MEYHNRVVIQVIAQINQVSPQNFISYGSKLKKFVFKSTIFIPNDMIFHKQLNRVH